MDLSNILSENCSEIGASLSNKDDVLKSIASLAKKNSVLDNINEEDIYNGLIQRESLSSTGFGNSIAIPHCAIENIDDFVLGVITIPDGVDFEALDGKPIKLLVYIILPKDQRTQHIRVLSKISNVLKNKENVLEIINSKTAEIVRENILRQTYVQENVKENKEHNLFNVFIQKEELFENILSIFAEVQGCNISVIEGADANRYLYAQPLFSNFWSNTDKGFHRIVVAVVNKSLSNDIIRKINSIIDDSKDKTGVLMVVQNLFYVCGSLNI